MPVGTGNGDVFFSSLPVDGLICMCNFTSTDPFR